MKAYVSLVENSLLPAEVTNMKYLHFSVLIFLIYCVRLGVDESEKFPVICCQNVFV